jgi:hypothetical protein
VQEGEATAGEALIAITDEQGKTVQYRTVAKQDAPLYRDACRCSSSYGHAWHVYADVYRRGT